MLLLCRRKLFKNFLHGLAYALFPGLRTIIRIHLITCRTAPDQLSVRRTHDIENQRADLIFAHHRLTAGLNLTGLRWQKPLDTAPEIKNISG